MVGSTKKESVILIGLIIFILILFCIGIGYLGLKNILISIAPNERGVVLSQYQPSGFRKEVLEPGLHLLLPGERIMIYDISQVNYTMSKSDSISGKTLDGKEFFAEVSVTYALDPNKILEIHIIWQDHYQDGIVRPETRAVTRDILSGYSAYEINAQLPQIEELISSELEEIFSENNLIFIDFTILSVK